MSPIPTMTEVAASVVTNGTNNPQGTSIDYTRIVGQFFIDLIMVLGLLFVSIWILALCIAAYYAMNEWRQSQKFNRRKASTRHKKQRAASTQLNLYLISKTEGAKEALTEDKSEPKNYGTMSKTEAKDHIRAQEDEYPMRSFMKNVSVSW